MANLQSKAGLVCIGTITGVHGIKGLVKLQSFAEHPRAFKDYGALTDEAGQTVRLEIMSAVKGQYLARIDGVNDRTAAEKRKGQSLYVNRAALPETASDEFYQADLIGLAVFDAHGASRGKVIALHDYGAGTVLEIGNGGQEMFLPCVKAFIASVDIAGKRLTLADYSETE